ncbi:SAM-dependent methyltransferase [Pedobacter ginsengisoli]|uniref:SAM-dependent methyltransferase n=1 Tax=Pedobacter ginsengisoli TaxID=363852 RepID=A0A2D1UB35_9SPHI|nr:SAM-dependent methyltransferase [Pedobacter ginsengisoli]ATP58838.1 SAM-dependent methyltransferase [Pedobacter ginsengisoli]
MSNQLNIQLFLDQLSESISLNLFLKASLGNYHGNEKELKNIYVRRVKIKRVDVLSFNYRYKTRDIFKNLSIPEGSDLIGNLISNDFRICTLFTTEKEVIIEHGKKGAISLRERQNISNVKPNLAHDREKKRIIGPEGKTYLQDLKITDQEGNVFKNSQDKYKQINQYIEILSSLIKEISNAGIRNVVDMGSGKGYLTFALYDYLHNVLNLSVNMVGVEFREDLVQLCNGIAEKASFNQLRFEQGSIDSYSSDSIDLLIALHACDTATDDAIYKGIKAKAELIVVAPCCHKQIRREMEKGKAKNSVSFLTKYGIFLERQAEMITDGIRALVLEYFGYKTKVFEFISDVHTPKNVLVVGIKGSVDNNKKTEILAQIEATKDYFGISYHHLEKLLKEEI